MRHKRLHNFPTKNIPCSQFSPCAIKNSRWRLNAPQSRSLTFPQTPFAVRVFPSICPSNGWIIEGEKRTECYKKSASGRGGGRKDNFGWKKATMSEEAKGGASPPKGIWEERRSVSPQPPMFLMLYGFLCRSAIYEERAGRRRSNGLGYWGTFRADDGLLLVGGFVSFDRRGQLRFGSMEASLFF